MTRVAVVVSYFTPFYRQNEYGLCKALINFGYEPILLTSNRRMRKFYPGTTELRCGKRTDMLVDGFRVVYLPTVMDILEQPLMPTLISEIVRENCDIVHVHEDFQNSSLLASMACKLCTIPLVLSEERYYFPSGPWKRIYAAYSQTLGKAVRENAAAITSHTHAAKRFLVEQGVPDDKISVIPVGIDSSEFRPVEDTSFKEELHIPKNQVILTVARLHPNKGLTYLLLAMKKVVAKTPSARLVIVGTGPLETELRNLIDSLGLKESVFLVNRPIPNKQMPKVYASCDLFVLPSIKEPFGRVILEAMSCARAVVSTKVAGPLDLVLDGITGFLVQPKDIDQLAIKIVYLLEKPEKSKDFGKKGRDRVISLFDWDVVIRKYLRVYRDVVRG